MIRTAVTKNGVVRGLAADDPRVTVYRGIPFAAPPTGKNRWRAPQPCENWEGVRDCFEFGPISMQDQPGLGNDIYCREFHVDPDIVMSEDCLYLNVWSGAKSTDEKLPVLVWIYGGAFQWGYTAEMEFNGERLARHDVIVVSMAYRLGPFGFFAHRELTGQDSDHPSNFGLLDIQAALKWVHSNIAAFGGDPDNITLAGQSAGGVSVLFTLSSPENAHIIKKASVFSGLIRNPFLPDDIIDPKPIEEVYENGAEFLKALGVSSVDEARAVDAFTIRDVYFDYVKNHLRFVPCIDHVYIKEDPVDLLNRGALPDIPLLTGYTKDEFIDFVPSGSVKDIKIRSEIFKKSGRDAFNVVANCVRNAAYSHRACGLNAPMYTYRFSPDIPGDDRPGDFHSCDLWFFFETIQKCYRPYTGKHYELARRMCDYWTNFIRTGDPNGKGYDGNTLPVWNCISDEDPSKDEMIFL
ncbi:MAG: carboxylesterase family protein [Lachnospiraceae bacterium]|nr:carboxylesterase family protein [Lachnospiraceae bacterium]